MINIEKNQIWKFKDGNGKFTILSDNDKERCGNFGRIGWEIGGIEIPYGKTKEEIVHVDVFTTEEILKLAENTGQSWNE